jgi:hypothetical protein
MMRWTPKSLVQVHYHDRVAGVNKVIGLYATAFSTLTAEGASVNLVICGKSPGGGADFRPAATVDMPLCDYRTFSSKSRFMRITSILTESIDAMLKDRNLMTPACVIGHNLSLGKNCGLSAAFTEIARRYALEKDRFRFYSVIHDFAEEGRLDCLAEIEKVKNWTAIERDLFPPADIVRLITLNSGNAGIFEKAGFQALVLENPVEAPVITHTGHSGTAQRRPAQGRQCGETVHSALWFSKKAFFQNDLPVILYPSRCISRKNILEAILVCAFLYKSNLMIGPPGSNPKDKAAFVKAIALCKRYKLPVLFDYWRVFPGQSRKDDFPNRAFSAADACLTTSLAEGFGYGLYEPWLYGKAVFGRQYLGFNPIAGTKFRSFYDHLPVPVKWISAVRLRDKYWGIMNKCFGAIKGDTVLVNRRKFDRAFNDYFVKDETIDFGALDAEMQCDIIESLMNCPGRVAEWHLKGGVELETIGKNIEDALYKSGKDILCNQRRIRKHFSMEGFSKDFGRILSKKTSDKSSSGARDEILRQFCSFDRFRLLLATY